MPLGIQIAFLLAFSSQLVEVGIVREDAHLTLGTEHVRQVVHVVSLKDAILLRNLLCCHRDKCLEVYLFVAALEEALIKDKLVEVDILEHMMHLLV